MSGKLEEGLKKFWNCGGRKLKYEQRKQELEEKLKDNEDFQEYLKVLKKIEKEEKEFEELKKGEAYNTIEIADVDFVEGKNFDISWKRPYYKTQMNTSKFLKDYAPGSKMYEKYVKQTLVKGNLIIKWHNEEEK